MTELTEPLERKETNDIAIDKNDRQRKTEKNDRWERSTRMADKNDLQE